MDYTEIKHCVMWFIPTVPATEPVVCVVSENNKSAKVFSWELYLMTS